MAISGSLNFLSASEIGSIQTVSDTSTNRRYYTSPGSGYTDTELFIPNDFVGLNSNIYDPISASHNTLGYPAGSYESSGPYNPALASYAYQGGLIYQYLPTVTAAGIKGQPAVLNGLLHHRNGPYQHPMWKQIRGSEHPLSRYYRKNNLISIDYNNPIPTTLENASSLESGYKASEINLADIIGKQKQVRSSGFDKFAFTGEAENKENSPELSRTYTNNVNLKQYYEPVLTTKYKPLTYTVTVGSQTGIARQSLMNQMTFFSNSDLNSTLRISSGNPTTGAAAHEPSFRQLKHHYYSLFHSAKSAGARNFVSSERIYPRDINSFRTYKLKRPNYEENYSLSTATGTIDPVFGTFHAWNGSKGYDKKPGDKRTFWKAAQGGTSPTPNTATPANASGFAVSDGTTRLRTDVAARNSVSGINKLWGVEVEDTAVKLNSIAADGSNHASAAGAWPGAGTLNNYYSRTLFSASLDDKTHPGPQPNNNYWQWTVKFIANGIVLNQHNAMSGTLSVDIPTSLYGPRAPFIQLESYQPYEITALSMWPLDVRQDIYDKPHHLSSSVGGKGLQIGLTPHRAHLYGASNDMKGSGDTTDIGPRANFDQGSPGDVLYAVSGSIVNLKTGSAGELVYSTKPTLFFYKTGSINAAHDLEGYGVGKASIQYHRHTYPYNSPFYATHKIRGIDPYHNSYDDFYGDLKYVAKDYSIVPEYNITEHILDYYNNSAPLDLALIREQEVFTFKEVKNDPYSEPMKLFLPRTEAWYGMPAFSYKPEKHKADFLSIPGAVVTSSASGTFVQNFESADLYSYNDLYDPEGSDSLINVTQTASYGKYGNKYTNHWARDRATVKFSALFGNTDKMETFVNLLDQKASGFSNDVYTVPSGIKFKCHAIKKMRIDDGFYPVSRTTHLAKHFDEAFLYNAGSNPARSLWYGKTSVTKAYDPVNNTRTVAAMCKQTFLEPLFAPGVLYNSIKSGIAVDWPLYASNNLNNANPPSYYCSASFLSSSTNFAPTVYKPPGDSARVNACVTGTSNYGGLYMMGSSRCYPAVLTELPSHRLPFNALFDFKGGATDILANRNIFLPSDFVDLDRNDTLLIGSAPNPPDGLHSSHSSAILHPGVCGMAGSPAAIINLPITHNSQFKGVAKTFYSEISPTIRNTRAILYHSSINNFLCETMEFYLADAKQSIGQEVPGVKFPVITPRRSTAEPLTEREVLREKKLFMEVGLSMGLDQVMCEGPRRAGIPATSSYPGNAGGWPSSSAPGGGWDDDTKFGNTMRGYIYGPPMEIIQPNIADSGRIRYARATQNSPNPGSGDPGLTVSGTMLPASDVSAYLYFNLQDPAYQAYTPPYFYGESSKILSFTPLNTTDNYKEMWEISTQGIDSEFNAVDQGGSFYYEKYNTGSVPGDLEALCLTLPNTASISSGSATRMKIDASLEFSKAIPLHRTTDPSEIVDYTSYITPWWTCPVLDFSSSFSAVRSVSSLQGNSNSQAGLPISRFSTISNTYHDYTTGRGMWGGYGTDPYDAKAVDAVLNASDPPLTGSNAPNSKGLYITVKNIFADSESEYNSTAGYVSGIEETPIDGFFTSTTLHNLGSTNTQMSASLAEKLGFTVDTYPVGAMATNKRVREAIVVIPYLEQPIVLRTKSKTGTYMEGFNIESVVDGGITQPDIKETDLSFQGGELYSTREIIPGKHFLPINKALFNNMLSVMLTKKYIPPHKRGHSSAAVNYNISNASNTSEMQANLASIGQTDVGRMIFSLMGDLDPHTSFHGDIINNSHNLGFQLPPEFDFIHNSSVDPFQMLVIPFEHIFSKQDLVDMYQGIMPRPARFFEKVVSAMDVNPSRNTPPHMALNGQGGMSEQLPPWVPYIPTGGISAEASYYKNLFNSEISTALNEAHDAGFFMVSQDELNEETLLRVMSAYEQGLRLKEEFGWTGESYDSNTKMNSWQELFYDKGLDKDWGSGENLEKMAQLYNTYMERLKQQVATGMQGNAAIYGQSVLEKQHLNNIGLENFLCPPLMSGMPLSEHPLVHNYCDIESSTIPNWNSKQFYENLRFMVFKVKQRGAKDYKKYRQRQIHQVLKKEHQGTTPTGGPESQVTIPGEDVLENITFGEVYGTNWPYDYFSLIENIKIDIEVKVSK